MRKLLGVALPSALLAAVITMACDVGTPVSSGLLPNFEVMGDLGCPESFGKAPAEMDDPVDRNDDGFVCVNKAVSGGPSIRIDNNVPGSVGGCPVGFTSQGSMSTHPADRNGDSKVCVKTNASGNTTVIDNTVR
jgi:hypothetical protein